MALGDSTTGAPGCWRALLWRKLPAGLVDFVGSLPSPDCGFAYDGQNEGHSRMRATDLAVNGQLPSWLAQTKPDVVMMHLGTNDVWSHRPVERILPAYTALVAQMRAANPRVRVLVAQILPMNPAGCATCGPEVVDLDHRIPGWAARLSTPASPITIVDQWTGFKPATDTLDGVHPVGKGNGKVARRWLPALLAAAQASRAATQAGRAVEPPSRAVEQANRAAATQANRAAAQPSRAAT